MAVLAFLSAYSEHQLMLRYAMSWWNLNIQRWWYIGVRYIIYLKKFPGFQNKPLRWLLVGKFDSGNTRAEHEVTSLQKLWIRWIQPNTIQLSDFCFCYHRPLLPSIYIYMRSLIYRVAKDSQKNETTLVIMFPVEFTVEVYFIFAS